jgi:hypothetical protein
MTIGHYILAGLGAGLTVATALAAADPAPQAPESRRICRDSGRQLGSHVRAARRCRTAEQWRQEDEEKAQLPASLQVTQGQNDGQVGRQPQ